ARRARRGDACRPGLLAYRLHPAPRAIEHGIERTRKQRLRGEFGRGATMTGNKLDRGLLRVRRKLRGLYLTRLGPRQVAALAGHQRLIVTPFYDVEGDYARPGATSREIECVGRLLEIEKRYGIRSTYNVVARLALDVPQLVAAIARAGAEVASHSYDHSILTTMSRTAIEESLRRTRSVLEELGVTVRGHRSPQSAWNADVLDALIACGYAWS